MSKIDKFGYEKMVNRNNFSTSITYSYFIRFYGNFRCYYYCSYFGGVWEYNQIVFGNGFLKEKIEGLIFAIIIPAVVLFGNSQHLVSVLTFCVLRVFILFLWSDKESTFDVLSVDKVVFGMMYIPLLMSYFISLRMMEKGV